LHGNFTVNLSRDFPQTLPRRFSDSLPQTYPRICRDHIRAITGSFDAAVSVRLVGHFSALKIRKFATLIYAGVAEHIVAQKTFNFPQP
jgi:hypothetical protein